MIRVAIIGAGIGAEHLAAYQSLPDLFEVVSVCDLDLARAKEVAGEIAVTDDFDRLLEQPDIDLIDICLPPHLHVESCLKTLEAGKSAICEKPIANSLAEVDLLQAAQDGSSHTIFPVFQYRYGPAMAQLTALKNAGLFGRVYAAHFETHWCRKSDYYANPWRGTWRGENGGALLTHAIHAHDLITYLLGPIDSLYARTTTRVNDIETEDCASLSLEMCSGTLVTSSVTLGAATDETRIKIMTDIVTIESGTSPYAPMSSGWTFKAREHSAQGEIDEVLAQVETAPVGFVGYLKDVAAAMQGDANTAVTLVDGRRSVEFVTAAYDAARQGRPVSLPIEKSHRFYAGWQP